MPKIKYKSDNGRIEYFTKIVGFNEKQKKTLVSVPYSWGEKYTGKKLKVTIEVLEE